MTHCIDDDRAIRFLSRLNIQFWTYATMTAVFYHISRSALCSGNATQNTVILWSGSALYAGYR